MRFAPSFLDEIRARIPISQVVGRRVTWDRRKTQASKGDFWACCPFHQEKSPSFHCDDRRGIYHCFGCGVTGDHFRFLTEKEGLSFPEAVERLASEAGLPMPARDERAEAEEKKRSSLYDVMDLAARFYEEALQKREGAAARGYLARRGLAAETQRRFRLGYAPSSRNALKEHLAQKGVGHEEMVAAGLLVAGDDVPVSFDRFRDRVIFPITDFRGRVVAFGGRAMSDDTPAKYLNSPETPLFSKGALLYNGAEARKAARDKGSIIAVEGYVDVIALVTAGFDNAVAPLGTALTERQLDLLWRMAEEPILCFDGDAAGLRAAYRAIELALPSLAPGRSVRFALLPDGKDPDDLIRDQGREAMAQVLAAARPLVDMIWTRETEGASFETPERRAALEGRLRDAARQIRDETVRRHYEQALRERVREFFGFSSGRAGERPARRERPAAGPRGGDARRRGQAGPVVVSESLRRSTLLTGPAAPPLREAVLVMTLLNHPVLLADHLDAFATLELTNRELDSLRGQILEMAAEEPQIGAAALRARIGRGPLAGLLIRLDAQIERAGAWQAAADAASRDAEDGWIQALTLHRKARTLHKDLKEAEIALGADPSDTNFASLIDIHNQLARIEGTEALIEGFGESSGRRQRTM